KIAVAAPVASSEDRFYSPLVKNIARQEGISQSELDSISGTGKDGRDTKNDILEYLESKKSAPVSTPQTSAPQASTPQPPTPEPVKENIATEPAKQEHAPAQPTQEKTPEKPKKAPVVASNGDEIIELTKIGRASCRDRG